MALARSRGGAKESARGSYARIYAVVRSIPRGRVATYGQVATLAGFPGRARQVGYALHALRDDSAVPWHRVVNARGAISLPASTGAALVQRLRLEREGVRFDAKGCVPLARFRCTPPARRRSSGA